MSFKEASKRSYDPAMLDVRRLAVFQQVARLGSLSAAARALGYTQPAVAHQIAKLEAELGAPLIDRSARGVRLTEAGEALAAHGDELLAHLRRAEEEVAVVTGRRRRRVRIAAFPSAIATLVADALALLAGDHPDLAIGFAEQEPPEATAALARGDVEIAVVFEYPGAPAAPDAAVERIELLTDPVLAVLPSGHAAAAEAAVALADLADEPWIAGCERCRQHLVDACRRQAFEPLIRFATDDYVSVQRLVASGVGVSVLPALSLQASRRPDVSVQPLRPPHQRAVLALRPAGRPAPGVAATLEALQRAAAAYDGA
jgi:molybdate transport repressor ModE-like protein